MAGPLVSIILTVYERTTFIVDALESTLAQTYDNLEIIIADDSNSSPIANIVSHYRDARVLYQPNPVRLGIVGSLKRHIAEAKGVYISILNDDDVWEKTFVSSLVAVLEDDPSRILAFSDHYIIDASGNVLGAQTEENTRLYRRDSLAAGDIKNLAEIVLLYNAVPLAMASVFRKDALSLDLLFDGIVGAYDYWISMLLAAQRKKAYFVRERLTRYRIHDAMETVRKSADRLENNVLLYQKALELKLFPEYEVLLRGKLHDCLWRSGLNYLDFGERWCAIRRVGSSFCYGITMKSVGAFAFCLLPKRIMHLVR